MVNIFKKSISLHLRATEYFEKLLAVTILDVLECSRGLKEIGNSTSFEHSFIISDIHIKINKQCSVFDENIMVTSFLFSRYCEFTSRFQVVLSLFINDRPFLVKQPQL